MNYRIVVGAEEQKILSLYFASKSFPDASLQNSIKLMQSTLGDDYIVERSFYGIKVTNNKLSFEMTIVAGDSGQNQE